jgi:hypothetical protein
MPSFRSLVSSGEKTQWNETKARQSEGERERAPAGGSSADVTPLPNALIMSVICIFRNS